jgi:hypothetical protein
MTRRIIKEIIRLKHTERAMEETPSQISTAAPYIKNDEYRGSASMTNVLRKIDGSNGGGGGTPNISSSAFLHQQRQSHSNSSQILKTTVSYFLQIFSVQLSQ